MGTGKTVQAVNAIRILLRQGKIRSILIICPVITVGSARLSSETGKSEGWDGHFYHWAPELEVTVLRDKREQRKIDWQSPAHVYITTYDTFRNDLSGEILKEVNIQSFECVVLDEAQEIKNINSKISREIRKLRPKYRWALTGTPIENSVDDVKAIFEFVKPGLFEKKDYPNSEIKALIQPYTLRRLKRDVLNDLPEKIHQEEWLELNDAQKSDYMNALAIGRFKLAESVKTENNFQVRSSIFALIAKLKQTCNFAKGEATSPKTELLLEYLEQIIANNQKVIVFSQYRVEGIDKLAKLLELKSISYVSYVGGMSDKQREKAINDFRSREDIHVFLALIDSAGFGITLTEASYVIHFDHPWNPAKMQNAEDRAHRIGQANKLTVYSFWMKDTIEEGIKKKLYEKRLLVENIINPLAVDEIENSVSNEEWLDLLGVKYSSIPISKKSRANTSSKKVHQSEERLIDFAVVTAIETERLAVCEAFGLKSGHRVNKGSRVYWRGQLTLKTGEFYEIVVAQAPEMANVDAALLASDTIHHWQPEALLMVGIAGAASSEQQLGDIALANTIYYYERGKLTPNKLKPEPIQYPVDSTLWSRIIALPPWNEEIPVPRPDGTENRPVIHKGVIASGEKVIADKTIRDDIASAHRKMVAIEMEGYGVSKAAWQCFDRTRHLVIRSICDFADSTKNNDWHSYAANVAAGYTKHFLLDRPLDPRNLSS